METLVKPLREGDAALQRLFRDLLNSGEVRLAPATRVLWEAAAEIRAALNLCTLQQWRGIMANKLVSAASESPPPELSGMPEMALATDDPKC